MASSVVATFTWFLVGVVLGGLAIFGFIKLTEGDSGSDNSSSANGTRVSDSLQYVVVISRHGNRGPYDDYPLDPYPLNNTKYYPYGRNALTPYGRVQAYKLGVKIRSWYNGFLPSTFASDDIYACSDLYERVIMSGDLFLAGLYPPEGFQIWNDDVDWQPIALYTNSSDHTQNIDRCSRYKEEENVTLTAFLKEDAVNISTLISDVYKATNTTLTADDLSYMFEKLMSEETEGYTLPTWTNTFYPEPMGYYYGQNFIASCAGSVEVVRLWVGNLFEEILDSMSAVVNGTLGRKIDYYSGHDVTLLTLQVALGVPTSSIQSVIRPSSALVMELHKNSSSGDPYVKVLFINGGSMDSEPTTLNLASCGEPCVFDTFIDTSQQFTNVSFEEECQSSMPNTSLSLTQL